jgi:radical SAM protein with 4Fe4S-binding SPASM domain
VNAEVYQRLHPDRPTEDLDQILAAIAQLLDYGYPASQILNSVTFTGLQSAADMIETIDYFESRFGIATSLNVYHTYMRPDQSRSDLQRFIPSEEDVAAVYERWTDQTGFTDMPMNCVNLQYCSATAAVLCDGSVTPCATIRDPEAPRVGPSRRFAAIVRDYRSYLTFEHFRKEENRPPECRVCEFSDCCWGCRSRSYAAGLGLYGKDPRCFRSS